MPKWITRIELIDEDYLGYWESKPENKPFKWAADAVATINSRVDAPVSLWDDVKDPGNGGVTVRLQTIRGSAASTFAVHGIAMAGERTVEAVEVSIDGGVTWEPIGSEALNSIALASSGRMGFAVGPAGTILRLDFSD